MDRYEELSENAIDYIPDEFYYDAFGSKFVERGRSRFNYFGGKPLMSDRHTWPVCPAHGPLIFLWSAEELATGNVTQFFLCCNINLKGKEIEEIVPKYFCDTGGDIHISRGNIGYLARRLCKGEEVHERDVPVGVIELPKRDFDWKRIKLLDRDRISNLPREEHDFYNFGNNRYMHTDPAYELISEESATIENKHFLLHQTKGVPDQFQNLNPEFGYFVIVWNGNNIPFFPDRDYMNLHLNYDLVMKEVD